MDDIALVKIKPQRNAIIIEVSDRGEFTVSIEAKDPEQEDALRSFARVVLDKLRHT